MYKTTLRFFIAHTHTQETTFTFQTRKVLFTLCQLDGLSSMQTTKRFRRILEDSKKIEDVPTTFKIHENPSSTATSIALMDSGYYDSLVRKPSEIDPLFLAREDT